MPGKSISKKPTYAEVVARSPSPQRGASQFRAMSKVEDSKPPPSTQPRVVPAREQNDDALARVLFGDDNNVSSRSSNTAAGINVRKNTERVRKANDDAIHRNSDDDVLSSEEDSGVRLDKDDTMYRGRALNARVTSLGHTQSIIQTRSSKLAGQREANASQAASNATVDDAALSNRSHEGRRVAHAADLDTRGRQDVADHVEDDDVEDVNIHGRHRRVSHARRAQVLSEPEDGEVVQENSKDLDRYDLGDPFIDDSEVPVQRGRRRERDTSGSSLRRRDRRASPQWVDLEAEDEDEIESPTNNRSRHRPRRDESRRPIDDEVLDAPMPSVQAPSNHDHGKKRLRTPSPPYQRKRTIRGSPGPSSQGTQHSKGKDVEEIKADPTTPINPVDISDAGVHSRRTFASVFGRAAPAVSSKEADLTPLVPGTTYLGDFEYRQPADLPSKCEVTSLSLQDPVLRPFYKDLPNLRACLFESWNEQEGPGMVSFSKWVDHYPHMDFDNCLGAVNFVQQGTYINPARCSPSVVRIRTVSSSKAKFFLYTADRKPAMCISTILCKSSNVVDFPDKGLVQKSITGVFHTQEWERTVGFMGTAFGQKAFRAQVSLDAMQFTTRAHFPKKGGFDSPGNSKSMFSNVKSPAVSSKRSTVRASYLDTYSLDYDAEIPVYDCRDITVDYSTIFTRLDQLPRWDAEVPPGAFTLVAYTTTVYRADKTSSWTISFNLHWVMILGIPQGRA